MQKKQKILVTGTAGFIGFHTAKALLERGDIVVGLDNINDYYDINLKYSRLEETGISRDKIEWNQMVQSTICPEYRFIRMNLEDSQQIQELFKQEKFDKVIHLAAQAGVRYSLENPYTYIDSNIVGFINILEACRHHKTKHLIYASSSSVYGLNKKLPFATSDNVDHPISIYAATKKSNELMAHTYSHLFGLPTTGLRFFTVYGPWGRPDMALFIFTKAILNGEPIKIFNHGNMLRDFTYVDDIVEGIIRVCNHPPVGQKDWDTESGDKSRSTAPYKIYNIGNNNPVKLMDFIEAIEKALGKEAIKEYLPLQAGDVPATYAEVDDLVKDFGYMPSTSIKQGIKAFIDWSLKYYKKKENV